jgi:hypothetical protein
MLFSYADPSVFNKYQAGIDSIAELYQREGVQLYAANNDVKAGIMRIKQLLKIDPNHKHPLTGELGSPRIFVVASKCLPFIEEIKTYKWKDMKAGSPNDPVEVPVKKNDHAMDMMKYFVLSHIHPSPGVQKPLTPEQFTVWQKEQISKNAFKPNEEEFFPEEELVENY